MGDPISEISEFVYWYDNKQETSWLLTTCLGPSVLALHPAATGAGRRHSPPGTTLSPASRHYSRKYIIICILIIPRAFTSH